MPTVAQGPCAGRRPGCKEGLHIAGLDRFVPPEAQAEITGRLESVPGAEAYIYEGADHAFARKDGVRYLPEPAALADSRTVAFLERNLLG